LADKYVPIFYDWIEATQELNDQEKGRLIDAVVLYARGGNWQDRIKGNERYAFPVFQLQVDRAKRLSSVRADARNNKTEQKEQNASKSLTITNTNTKTNTRTNTSKVVTYASRFTPPKLDEVREYAKEKNWTLAQFDPEYFVDFYTSKGWKVGKETMKDWKACARGWVARGSKQSSGGRSKDWHNPALDYQQRGSDGKVDESGVQYWTAEQYEELARLCGTEDSQ
jgi:hypothetical protein